MSTTWLDVGVVRVQQYLTRTNTLMGHRSASGMVADELRRPGLTDVSGLLPGVSLESHDEAGDSDGVAHLRFSERVSDEDARIVAATVLGRLRRALPAAEFEASWGDGSTYRAALGSGERSATARERWVAPINGVPFARPCVRAGADIAVAKVDLPGRSGAVGRDTKARAEFERARRIEGHLRGAVGRLGRFDGRSAPADLNAVAASAPAELPDSSNHLATVAIDGNSMGLFFTRLSDEHPDRRRALSLAAKDAMLGAVGDALARIDERVGGGEALPFEVHVLGGDDVLFTVPAALGISAAVEAIGVFSDRMAEAVREHAPELESHAPTASAGVVIAHRSTPMSAVIDLADELLRRAKQGGGGSTPTLSWTDVTRFGDDVSDRPVFSRDGLEGLRSDVELLSPLGKSARNALTAAASHPVPDVAVAGVMVELDRRGRNDLRSLANDPALFAQLLDLTRWWF